MKTDDYLASNVLQDNRTKGRVLWLASSRASLLANVASSRVFVSKPALVVS